MRTVFTVKKQDRPEPGVLYLDVRPGVRELRRNMGGYTKVIQLPLRQFKFMQALMANHPKPMTHWELFYHVWGEGSQDRLQWADEDGGPLTPSSCITQYATKLRAKLAPMGLAITSPRKGYGYQINEQHSDSESPHRPAADGQQHQSAAQENPQESPVPDAPQVQREGINQVGQIYGSGGSEHQGLFEGPPGRILSGRSNPVQGEHRARDGRDEQQEVKVEKQDEETSEEAQPQAGTTPAPSRDPARGEAEPLRRPARGAEATRVVD